ncbi:MAG: FlgD immunoglobulin-like domain containing protein, partial [Candidatus Latescibacteria bacterium]|nr:FlgD immunoglobulin-like domain containing protein [Candidatus Latescibacterota bacterium]
QVAPEGLAQYSATVATTDIEIVGQPPSQSRYRVAALWSEGEPTITQEQWGYSVDNIAPVVRLVVFEPDPVVLVCWFPVSGDDIDHVELYRDITPGFTPGTPFAILHEPCYQQEYPVAFYYVARPIDLHGNAGPWTEMLHQDLTAAPELPAVSFIMQTLQPNPFNPCTLLRFGTTRSGNVRVEVFDMRGTRIALLSDGRIEAGWHEISWSGRDDAGLTAAAGTYVFRVTSCEGVLTRKAALIK